MTVYTGTEGDDDFVITSAAPGDEFYGLGGTDAIVLDVTGGTFASFNFNVSIFDSIERIEFNNPEGTAAFTSFDLLGNPFLTPGTELVGSAGRNSVTFSVSLAPGDDFIIPDITLVDWVDNDFGYTISLTSTSAAGVTLRANESLASMQGLNSGAGDDTLIGHSGRDLFTPGLGNDTMTGLGGDDVFYAINNDISALPDDPDQSGDSIDGGDGDDMLFVGGAVIAPSTIISVETITFGLAGISYGQGVLTLFASHHAAFLADVEFGGTTGFDGTVNFHLDTIDDYDASGVTFDGDILITFNFFGNDAANTITGTDQNDIFHGGLGDDVLIGGLGSDTADYSSAAGPVTVDLNMAGPQATGQGSDTLTGIENLTGSGFGDVLIGDGGSNILNGGAGSDAMYGGPGADIYLVDTQADLIFENALEGQDEVITPVGFYLYPNIEYLTLSEGAGDIFGVGNDSHNLILGNEGDNLLLGGEGNDTIGGGAGSDSIFGEGGNDILDGADGVDYIVGGAGNDSITGGNDADALYGGDGDDNLAGGDDFVTDILVGGDGNDVLNGISGLNDYDLMDGGLGDDVYYVDTGDDLTFEAADGGNDTVIADISGIPNAGVYLYANVEHLILAGTTAFGVGNELDNQLTGSDSANWLLGGAGNDTITGMGGNDVLFGEAGNDTFVFAQGSGGDVIGDFTHGEDQMDISAFEFESFEALSAGFSQVGGDGAIDLGNSDFIVLHGVTMADLDAGDFVL